MVKIPGGGKAFFFYFMARRVYFVSFLCVWTKALIASLMCSGSSGQAEIICSNSGYFLMVSNTEKAEQEDKTPFAGFVTS